MPTNIPSITPLPTPVPQTSDPTNFQARGDTFLAALPTLATEQNAAITAMNTVADEVTDSAADALVSQLAAAASAAAAINATTLVRRASNSLSIGTGTKNLTGLNSPSQATFANGDEVMIIDATNQNNRMWGAVSSAVMGSGTMTVTVSGTNFTGTGTGLTNWIVCLAALAPTVSYADALSARNYHTTAAAIL